MSASACKGVNRGAEEGALGRHALRPVLPGAQPPLPPATAPSRPPPPAPTCQSSTPVSFLPLQSLIPDDSPPPLYPRRGARPGPAPPQAPALGPHAHQCAAPHPGNSVRAREWVPQSRVRRVPPLEARCWEPVRRPPGRGWLGGRGVLSPRAPRLRLGPRSAARCPARPSGRWDRPVPRRRAGP